MTKYNELSDKQKEAALRKFYTKKLLSFSEIAKQYDTYPNRLRRDAHRFGIEVRSRSDAAKVALSEGRSTHPTEGTLRSEETKLRISESQATVWESLSDDGRNERSQIGKDSWDKKTDVEKANLIQKGSNAVREAARTGSKLEKFLLHALIDNGFQVQFHREHILRNQRLHIDLYVDDLRTAIEVDGPSHFKPIWGEQNLARNQKSDAQKTGLILSGGFALIRIRQQKRNSQKYFRDILSKLLATLQDIKNSFPKKSRRYIEL